MFHYLYLKQKIMYNQIFQAHGITEKVDDKEFLDFLMNVKESWKKNWLLYAAFFKS